MSSIRATYTGHNPDRIVIRSVVGGQSGPLHRDLDERSLRVLARARELVGVRTGTLLTSIRREQGTGPRGPFIDVVAGVPGLTPYMGWHHYGTEPHVIRARRRKTLRFIGRQGQLVFRRQVFHPGTVGTYFLTRALDFAR